MADDMVLVPIEERSKVARAVCTWLNTCPDIPVSRVEYEYLTSEGMTVSAVQTAHKSKQYIDGSYQAQFIFALVYRSRPGTADERFSMDETLENVAQWCESNVPALGGNMLANNVKCTDNAIMTARYDDGTEDHQISMQLTYEVIING